MAERVDDGAGTSPAELPIARPPVDRVRMAAARARAQQSLFGSAEPARFGRYVLAGDRADGGMGVVYAAYDPDLHRKVALKVLHPRRQGDSAAHQRLLAEARALARFDHPNVVKVHDVISFDGQIVIVMEWIEGTTLAAWEQEQHSWHEIVRVYLQAGRGLAAAHGVGVVHRDFKPANVIVGHDGRVRVLDFGLARPASDESEPPLLQLDGPDVLGSPSWAAGVTATGDMVGTLAYASPEQISGSPATPASDQFSFGVALHRALEGVPPFAGDKAADLLRHIRAGRVAAASDDRAVPAWLRSVVHRALAATPAARFPSMAALLAELARLRGWRRWRVPLAVTACALIAALAVITRPGATDPLASCDGGVAEVAAVWSPAARARVQGLLDAMTAQLPGDGRARVLGGLDGYRDRWTALHRDACVAHRRGTQSAGLLDRRMRCMQRRLGDLRATVGVLDHLDPASARHAVDLVVRMPALAECADPERLEAETPPPANADQGAAVAAVREHLSQAAALDRAGLAAEALEAAAAAVRDAERSTYPPVVAEAALLQGRILMTRREFRPAAAALAHARSIALEQRLFSVAVEAAARKIYVDGMEDGNLEEARRDAAILLPLSQGVPGDHFAVPLLLNNLGTVAIAAGDRAQASQYFQLAHNALAGVDAIDLELTCIDKNLAMVTADAAVREDLIRRVWQRLHAELGEANLMTLEALSSYARYTKDPAAALPLLDRTCGDFEQFHPGLTEPRIYCQSYLAFLTGEQGGTGEELRIYERIADLARGSTDEEVVARGRIATGFGRFLRGDLDEAIRAWAPVAAADAHSPSWWVRARAAHAEVGLGLAEHARSLDRDAADHLNAAIGIYRGIAALLEETEYPLRIAQAERVLAEIEHHSGTAPVQSRPAGSGTVGP